MENGLHISTERPKKGFNNTVFQHFVSDLRSHSTLKTENFKSNFFLVHGVPIRLK